MTETRTEVKDPTGFVHTGTGDIVVNLRESVARRVRGSRLVPRDDVSWLRRRFADPEHLGSARDKLLLNRTLLLAGPPGSGRRTAAKILLNEHTDDDVPFEVLAEDDRLDQVQVDVRHRLLLDLSAADAETFRARQRELPAFRTALHQRDAYLVVVLPDSLDHQVDAEFAHHVAAIGRPDGRTALRRHLEAEDVWPAKHDLDAAGLDAHLSGPMRDIAALARLVVQARDSGRGDGVAGWLREAVEAVAERGREVADQLADHQAGRARTLLLAAAMCRGAPADAVFFASHRLVEMLGLGAGEKPRLEQDGYRSQLSALEIDVSEDDRIGFRRFAYDRAVRAHFWDNYPDLRWQFRQWVDHLVRRVPLGREDRENLVERYVAEALRTGTPEHVVSLVDEWVKPGSGAGPRYLVDLGVQALVLGLRDERHGRRFRRLVYDWSRDGELPAGVGQLVVHACTEVIAPTFPNQALVRLHHRARREDGTGDPTALQALRDLVSRNRGLLAVLLDRLVEAFARQERWYADLVLFLDIAEPWRLASAGRGTPLVAQSWVRQRLVFGWSVVLRHQPDSAQGVVHSWLDAAGRIDRPDLLLGVLVEAASPDVGQLARLYVTARDWAASGQGRPEVVARLSELIDTAQGIRPGDFTYRPAVEETVG